VPLLDRYAIGKKETMSDLSHLEEHFPRLVSEILAFWGSPTCFERLQGLLMDSGAIAKDFSRRYSELSLLLTLVPRPKGPYDI
jgi:hypothetical protein